MFRPGKAISILEWFWRRAFPISERIRTLQKKQPRFHHSRVLKIITGNLADNFFSLAHNSLMLPLQPGSQFAENASAAGAAMSRKLTKE